MALSYTLRQPLKTAAADAADRLVLITGAAGNIGSYFAEQNRGRYRLRLMLRNGDKEAGLREYGEIVKGDITNLEQMKELCRGADTVLHLAASASPSSTWDEVLPANIIGTYNVFAAAKSADCRRVIYASSIHAVSGYPPDVQVKTSDPVNPGDLYGVSKCFGEALARYCAEKENLSAIALRIGAFQPIETAQDEANIGLLDAFVSQRDLNQLIIRCIDAEHIQWAVFNGLSNNRFKRLDLSDARELVGYEPQDDLAEEHPQLEPTELAEDIRAHSKADASQQSGMREEVD
ncbi:MAG: UDP-glucose 4-epimerase [uncultured Chthoniobacterales bacterium]|uniref:UDP-glucose 4-epimerase n=1 Tax=uncultured Chthoniobacterales bacterium TaxID=1836801 RepID=A0A6J4IG55_9BACT|nr:MAG: UDP-glucose 4-epimerase [uncultured Chthoniobacterales bacterium]